MISLLQNTCATMIDEWAESHHGLQHIKEMFISLCSVYTFKPVLHITPLGEKING